MDSRPQKRTQGPDEWSYSREELSFPLTAPKSILLSCEFFYLTLKPNIEYDLKESIYYL